MRCFNSSQRHDEMGGRKAPCGGRGGRPREWLGARVRAEQRLLVSPEQAEEASATVKR